MSDYSLPPCVTLVFGRAGSGKTTFAFRYLVNAAWEQECNQNPSACTFIFDWKLEASQRLGIAACGSLAQCEAAIKNRWVVFNPAIMFQARQRDAFRWFCTWVFEVSRRGPGKKIIYVDELWRFADAQSLPIELETIARMGRSENLELLSSTQHPRDYHRDIRAEVTEWVCFSMDEPGELDAVRHYFREVDKIVSLPRGSFIGYNRESGAQMAGKLF
jgi:hypothetical protein